MSITPDLFLSGRRPGHSALGASINLTASVGVYMATDFPQQFEDLSANLFIR